MISALVAANGYHAIIADAKLFYCINDSSINNCESQHGIVEWINGSQIWLTATHANDFDFVCICCSSAFENVFGI